MEPTINDIDNATPGSGPCPLAPSLSPPNLPTLSPSCHIQYPPHWRQIDDHNFSYCAADIDSKGRGEKGSERGREGDKEWEEGKPYPLGQQPTACNAARSAKDCQNRIRNNCTAHRCRVSCKGIDYKSHKVNTRSRGYSCEIE